MMTTLTEVKHTPNAISFVVEMPATKMAGEVPEIKKRLEAESAAFAPQTSLEQINAKLEKAEEKRRLSLHQQTSEEKRKRVYLRKTSLEQAALEKNTTYETTLSMAEQKREQAKNSKIAKI